jgi:F-type H+-transporting ATPase subunit f
MANNVPPYENSVPKNALEKLGWGCYPPEYNRKIHGVYHPGRYYGPKDYLSDIKMRELPQWIGRRNKTPRALVQLFDRAWHRWHEKFAQPRKAGIAYPVQLIVMVCTFSYVMQWKTLKHHKNQKYHW